mmetsp:Transcript_13550/g.26917  ORF Transcript_13550/g.26917 Transcript_13550/m.26917 type:complete len:438 (+) Transcript_13550:33-1346(+)|eukprot:CAMPEP_0182454744 /NCGR_PEP_ID=MMETSP1319-20130603/1239_1 /TAXON_ID=172717 /ORGANISM="Bolidomonas pacifica, Strain RCC208" /LENGTH=437 /DNA_ID=CAMNT_0024652765 /DNA_START=21 /DNA_END=1334 /DNA_ORIENTATION=-
MSHFVRASKFRHVFCDPPKPQDCWTGFRLSTATGEQNYINCSTKFFSVAVQGGGGSFAVVPLDAPGRFETGSPVVAGHTSAVLDTAWNPFHDNVVASGSDDASIKVWGIPEGGLTEHMTEPLVDLRGHERKVTLLEFHPTANNVLASCSGDFTIRLWDVEKGTECVTLAGNPELIQDMAWSIDGAMFANSCKDKTVRLWDTRGGTVASEIAQAHEGAKSVKMSFLGGFGTLLTVGFTRQSQRQFKIWDPRALAEPLTTVAIDQAAGVIMPFYDPDTHLLYLAGKGDGNVRYYEMTDGAPHQFAVSEHRSTTAQKGMACVPKRGLDVMRCETSRMLKLTSNSVEPLSFVVPRKSESFQEDIFPDTAGGTPAISADEFFAGQDSMPVTMSLRPGAAGAGGQQAFTPAKSAAQLQRELDEANARIELLTKRLADAGLSTE